MANTFKTQTSTNIGTTPVVIYTCPSNTTTTIIGMSLANVSTDSPIYVSVVFDASGRTSGAEDSVYIIKEAPVAAGGTLVPIGGDQKIVMEPGDVVKVLSDTENSVDVVMSHLDIS